MLKLNLGAGDRPLDGFTNLDLAGGWRFQDGLGYEDGTVDAITVSHALMYVPLEEWADVFSEFQRALAPGGVIRISEDDTANPLSDRFGGHHDATALTSPAIVRYHLELAGFAVNEMAEDATCFDDGSLLQAWHGPPPKVFFVEGVKP